jgi:hypothetical protein
MNYFTPALIKRMNDPDIHVVVSALEEWETQLAAYERRLKALGPKLPRSIKRYLHGVHLHDADFCGALETKGRSRRHAKLSLLFRQRDQMVTLQYDLIGPLKIKRPLTREHWTTRPLLGYDEFELGRGGQWEHRILLSTGEELTMRFTKFQVIQGNWLLPVERQPLKAVS